VLTVRCVMPKQIAREGDAAARRLGVGTLLGVAAPLLQQAIVSGGVAQCIGSATRSLGGIHPSALPATS
jgi:hypothetical protein